MDCKPIQEDNVDVYDNSFLCEAVECGKIMSNGPAKIQITSPKSLGIEKMKLLWKVGERNMILKTHGVTQKVFNVAAAELQQRKGRGLRAQAGWDVGDFNLLTNPTSPWGRHKTTRVFG